MSGRTGLTWVTALTVASLLLGGGALTALADGHGGGKQGGGGHAAVVHQQDRHNDDDLVKQPDRVTGEVRPGKGCGDQNHEHERHDECGQHGGHGDDQGEDD